MNEQLHDLAWQTFIAGLDRPALIREHPASAESRRMREQCEQNRRRFYQPTGNALPEPVYADLDEAVDEVAAWNRRHTTADRQRRQLRNRLNTPTETR